MSEPTVVIVNSATFDKAIAIPNAVGVRYFHMTDEELQALREFFLAERDAELGRWRWSEDQDVVVYPPDEDGFVKAFNERTRDDFSIGLPDWRHARKTYNDPLWPAIYDYATAHPEPKPWHEANPGEVWDAELQGADRRTMFTHWAEHELIFIDVQGNLYDLTDPAIISARKRGA